MRYNITIWIGKCDNTLHDTTRHHVTCYLPPRPPSATPATPTNNDTHDHHVHVCDYDHRDHNHDHQQHHINTHRQPPQRRHRLPRQRDNHNHIHIHRGSRRDASRVQVCFFFTFFFSYYMLTRYLEYRAQKHVRRVFEPFFLCSRPHHHHTT